MRVQWSTCRVSCVYSFLSLVAVVSFFYVESYYLRYFSKPMAVELPIFTLSKPGGCIDTRYFPSLVVVYCRAP